jgi:integrase
MRGSVYHQTANLVKIIFIEGAKKEERVDPKHDYYQCIASFSTMDTYRRVWNNFFNYLREHWKIKNCELITEEHIEAYFEYKIEYYPSKQYAEKISSALGKLEVALNKYSKKMHEYPKNYNFQIRQNILNKARDFELVANNYLNRTYQNPLDIIESLSTIEHKIAAKIQLEGGARVEGIGLIRKEQLRGIKTDDISKKIKGIIETKEKGGKIGDVLISLSTYQKLEKYFKNSNTSIFKINYKQYIDDIKNACFLVGEKAKGSHGFRWTFAQNRVREYQKHSYTYEQALQGTSWEMKHFRASITEHYLGR